MSSVTPTHSITSQIYSSLTTAGRHNSSHDDSGGNLSTYNSDNTNPRTVNGSVVLILLLLNLMGNGVVFYIYKFKIRKSVFSFFVTILAALDIITALTTMLMDVIVKMRPLNESVIDLNLLCKLTHFQVYATSLISGCVLTLIAYQRYRKICHPLKPSLKMRNARYALLIMILTCILLSACTLVIHGPQEVQVEVGNHVVRMTICRYDKTFEGTVLQHAFSYLLFTSFALVLCLTVGFYVMVAKALIKFERRNSRNSPSSPDADRVTQPQGYTPEHSAERKRVEYQRHTNARMSVMSMGGGNERISTQMYKVFTIVTAVFVISYLPHLVVLILTKSLNLDHIVLTYTQRIILDFAYNCPYISTIINPIVYGFRSAEFREHCKQLLTCKIWRQRRAYRR